MREIIASYRNLLVARMEVLAGECRLAQAQYKEREGDYHYVVLENVAVMERQIGQIEHLRAELQAMDLDRFETSDAFKAVVLARLQELYDARAFLRPAVRMVMECVRHM